MSDNIPFEIQEEIMKRLPVKWLIQFRSVSKEWKSLIDSADFIKHYSGQMQHLLVRYDDSVDFERKYVSIVDDDTFPQQKVPVTIPQMVKMLKKSITVGSSQGLLCLYGDYQKSRDCSVSGTARAVIWNPSIRKAVDVVVPNVLHGTTFRTVLGFGVCPGTTDVKIVKIACVSTWIDIHSPSYIPRQVEVFTLSTGTWRSPYSNLPRTSLRFHYNQVGVGGFLYWFANDEITMDGESMYYRLIISFNMTSEEFREVNLPDSLTGSSVCDLSLSKLRESVVVVERGLEGDKLVFRVWMMEDGVSKSFTKLFTINTQTLDLSYLYVIGIRKTGEPIIKIVSNRRESGVSLAVYEPYSKSINNIGVNGRHISFFVRSYMETLLLL